MRTLLPKFGIFLISSLITFFSILPFGIPQKVPWQDKIVHLFIYGLLSLTAVQAFSQEGLKCPLKTGFWYAFLLGLSLEVSQFFLPYREFDWWDIGFNLWGSLCGTFIAFITIEGGNYERCRA
jgi:VanZ family protein